MLLGVSVQVHYAAPPTNIKKLKTILDIKRSCHKRGLSNGHPDDPKSCGNPFLAVRERFMLNRTRGRAVREWIHTD